MRLFIYIWRRGQCEDSRASVSFLPWFSFVPKQKDLSGLKSLKFTVKKKRVCGGNSSACERQTVQYCAETPARSLGHVDMLLAVTFISSAELPESIPTQGTERAPSLFLKCKSKKSFL